MAQPDNDAQEQFVVIAIHSFNATAGDQLSLQKGELLTVIKRDHSGWWIGKTANGRHGVFPSTYVQRVSNDPPPEEAANTIARERLLHKLHLTSLEPVIREMSRQPQITRQSSAVASVYVDDLFVFEEDELRNERDELSVAIDALGASGLQAFTNLIQRQGEAESEGQRATLTQQLMVSQRRAQALRQELEEARDEKSLTLMNMKDADIPVPAVLSSKGGAAKPPAAKAMPVPQPIVKKVVKKVKRQSKAPVAAPSAADVPQDLLDRAGGDVRVARYLQKLSKEWESVDARLNDMEASMTAAERTTVDLDRQLQEVASAPASGAASPASGSPSATKDLKKIQKKIAAAEAESQKLEDEKRTITDEVAKLQAQVESGATTFAALQETLETTTSSVAEARAKREALSLQADELRAAIEQTTKRAAEVAKELEEIKAKAQAKREEEVQAYRRLEKQRRVVYNQLQELRGNLRVYCRLRPRPAGEKAFVEPVDDITLKVTDPVMETSADYEFDLVMPEQTAQKDVFAEVQPLVTSVLDGYNVCVFAYGQTGSGKTHTMEGSANDRGVSFRTLTELFALAVARESEGYKTEFNLSVLEVYNDKIFDLLAGRKPAAARWGGKDVGVVVQPQQLEPVKSVEQVENLLQEAYKNRSVAGTDCNQHSSRSHCLLTIHVKAENASAKARFAAKLHLIDLAGSERVKSSGVEGDRLKEASHINMSLTHLKSVIQALAGKDDKHVPFRNSALTSLLQDSLGGNCKCLMFANVSTLGNNVPETICTLKYAAGARKVVVGKVTARVTKTAE